MKRYWYVWIVIALCQMACEEIDELTKFDMEYDSQVTIPSTTGLSLPVDILTPDMKTNSASTFAINDTRKDLVEEIKLKTLDLIINNPEEEDFSFIKSINIYIEADNLSKEKIAWNDNVSAVSGNKLSLETTDIDLKEYIKKDEFSLTTEVVTDEVINTDYTIYIQTLFGVNAKILGI